MAQNSQFGISTGPATAAGAITLLALGILIALRMGFRGVVIKMGK